jgi:hypothetical protein
VRKTLSAFPVVLSALCVICLFSLPAHGQGKDEDRGRDNEKGETAAPLNGIVQDWSRRHVVYPRFGPLQSLIAVQNDSRAILSWQEQSRKDWRRVIGRRHPHSPTSTMHRDWSISLGGGTVAPGMFPAKFGLDPTAAPTCADFAVFPVNATGSASQPNIVAFKNLYSGGSKAITGNTNSNTTVTITAGTVTAADVGQPISGIGIPGGDTIAAVTGGPPATTLTLATAATATNAGVTITVGTGTAGFCSSRAAVATVDNSLQATTMWSYDIDAVSGKVVTSPALSLDGTKIAFVESAVGATHFHVLAWKSGDGFDATNGQNVLLPKVISGGFSAVAPSGGTGAVTDLTLPGGASDTLSSPFVEFDLDVAYVGNDSGTLFRIKNVFCTKPCTPGTSPAPSLDLSWPTSGGSALTGTLSVCAGALTGPVEISGGNVYVGCADGKLYGITPTGTILGSVTVGNGLVDGGVVDPPMADVVNGFVYAVSGNNGANSVLVQAPTNLSSSVVATLGSAGKFNLHSPTFNEDYFSCTPQSAGCTWRIFALALDTGDTHSGLWEVDFTGAHAMNSGAGAFQVFGINPFEFSPATTFFDGVQDRLFESVLTNSIGGNLVSFNVSNGTTMPFTLESNATEGAGTSGIIVDNNGTGTVQADSIYFGALTANTAVKLTQSALK